KSNGAGEELHALDYQAYAYLQIGQDAAAKAVVDRASEVARAGGSGPANSYAIAAIPARYALERGKWAEAAALTPTPANTPYTEAITHFSRAIGAARSGAPAAAAVDIERLAALRDKEKGRGARAVERRRRRRGLDRQVGGLARPARPGPRALWRDAARGRQT